MTLSPTFGGYVSAINLWILLPLTSNFLYLAALTVSRIFTIPEDISIMFLDAKSGYDQTKVRKSYQENLRFLLPMERKIQSKSYLSGPRMIQTFTQLWCSLCMKIGYFYFPKQSILLQYTPNNQLLFTMIKSSLMIFYLSLAMSLHSFTIFLVLHKYL